MFSNAKQHVPMVFQLITANQHVRAEMKKESVIPFKQYRDLKRDMDHSLRPAAEKMLRWNTDKGNAI